MGEYEERLLGQMLWVARENLERAERDSTYDLMQVRGTVNRLENLIYEQATLHGIRVKARPFCPVSIPSIASNLGRFFRILAGTETLTVKFTLETRDALLDLLRDGRKKVAVQYVEYIDPDPIDRDREAHLWALDLFDAVETARTLLLRPPQITKTDADFLTLLPDRYQLIRRLEITQDELKRISRRKLREPAIQELVV